VKVAHHGLMMQEKLCHHVRREEQSFTAGKNQCSWRISQGWTSTTTGKL